MKYLVEILYKFVRNYLLTLLELFDNIIVLRVLVQTE